MVVYVEYAFIENFLLDFCLLFLAVKTARGKLKLWRILFGGAVGAIEAIFFPLLTLPTPIAYLLKFVGGAALVLVAASGRVKTYIVALVAFFAYTFALGGLLTAIYSFFGVEYLPAQGYLVERAPVGLILGAGGAFTLLCSLLLPKIFQWRAVQQKKANCTLAHCGKTVHLNALIDSGNLLTFHGEPVNLLSPLAALALFQGETRFVGSVSTATVNGTRELPLLRCEKLSVNGGKTVIKEGALFAVSELNSKEYQIILHTAIFEEEYGHHSCAEIALTKDKRK